MINDANAIWQEMLSKLEVEVYSLGFDVWIKPLRPVKIEDGVLILSTATATSRDRKSVV